MFLTRLDPRSGTVHDALAEPRRLGGPGGTPGSAGALQTLDYVVADDEGDEAVVGVHAGQVLYLAVAGSDAGFEVGWRPLDAEPHDMFSGAADLGSAAQGRVLGVRREGERGAGGAENLALDVVLVDGAGVGPRHAGGEFGVESCSSGL